MFLTQRLREAVVRFHRAIARKQGLCAILGANGLGKSTLLRFVAGEYLHDDRNLVSYIPDSRKCGSSAFAFLKVISEDFGIPPKRSQAAQLDAIENVLLEHHGSGKTTIVFIDEAQRLTLDTFEVVRALLNYETATEKMIQVVIAGQLELRDKFLEQGRYAAIQSRIVAPLLMKPLSFEEAKAMIEHRLHVYGLINPFAPEAFRDIYTQSFGIPRKILAFCQLAYDLTEGEGQVTQEHVARVFEQIQLADEAANEELPVAV